MTAAAIKSALSESLGRLTGKSTEQLLEDRYQRLMSFGYAD